MSYLDKGRRTMEWAKAFGEDSTKALISLRSDNQEESNGERYDFDEFFSACDEGQRSDEESSNMGEGSEISNFKSTNDASTSSKRKRDHFPKDERILESLLQLVREKKPDLLELDTNSFFLEFFRANNILLDSKKLDNFVTSVKKIIFAEWKDKKFHEKVIEMSKNPFVFNNRPCYYSIDYSYWLMLRLLKSQFNTYEDMQNNLLTMVVG